MVSRSIRSPSLDRHGLGLMVLEQVCLPNPGIRPRSLEMYSRRQGITKAFGLGHIPRRVADQLGSDLLSGPRDLPWLTIPGGQAKQETGPPVFPGLRGHRRSYLQDPETGLWFRDPAFVFAQ